MGVLQEEQACEGEDGERLALEEQNQADECGEEKRAWERRSRCVSQWTEEMRKCDRSREICLLNPSAKLAGGKCEWRRKTNFSSFQTLRCGCLCLLPIAC